MSKRIQHKTVSKTRKNIVAVTVLLLVWLLLGSLPVFASSRDVTDTIRDKKSIVRLIKQFRAFSCLEGTDILKPGHTKTYDFSLAKNRRKALQYIVGDDKNAPADYNGNVYTWYTQKISKRIFGVKTNSLKKYSLGDFGDYYPELKSIRIYQNSSTKFEVHANVVMVEVITDWNIKKKKVGNCVLSIQKQMGSHYGYVAKKLKVTR